MLEHVESVVGGLDDVKFAAGAKFFHYGLKKLEIGERVASALQKEHRHRDFGQVIGALGAGTVRRMKWKAEEDETAYIRDETFGSGV